MGFPEAKSSCMTSVEVLHPKACWPLGPVFSDMFFFFWGGGSVCLYTHSYEVVAEIPANHYVMEIFPR